MIYSMTGFAAVNSDLPNGVLTLELRSVNHRYLDVQFRMSEELRSLEPALRELIGRHMSRGKVDCRMQFTARAGGANSLEVDEALMRQLVELNGMVRAQLPEAEPLRVVDILRWPGVIVQEATSAEALAEAGITAVQRGLEELNATRGREGEKLKALLLERVALMEQLAVDARPHLPKVIAAYREKLINALQEAGANADDERVRQELALFAQKIDVDEELSRLHTHLAEVRRVLAAGGTAGKRLDFLMQELNREANTLGSKSVAAELSQLSMELKVLIEQMREQVQNIE